MESMQVLRGAVRNQFMLLIKFKDQVSSLIILLVIRVIIKKNFNMRSSHGHHGSRRLGGIFNSDSFALLRTEEF